MYRLFVLAAVITGCGEIECDEDTLECNEGGPGDTGSRPATLEYVTTTILKPNCAPAQCHSAFSYVFQYRFDTVEHANESIGRGSLIVPGNANDSFIDGGSFFCCGPESVLMRKTQDDGTAPRMPYDQPLQIPDLALIKRWINEGADGLVLP